MSESAALYQEAIKEFARAAHGAGRLDHATGEAKLDNPLCGDRVRMQVAVSAGRITAIAHETRGCLLCRAAASAIAARASGLQAGDIEVLASSLAAMFDGKPLPGEGWPELAMFAPARAYPSRHRCVLLPFRALLAALNAPPSVDVEK